MHFDRRFCRLAIAVGAVVLAMGFAAAAEEPTLEDIGKWVKKQLDDGRLAVDFYDPARPPKPFPGWTDFEFKVEYRYDYRFELLPKKKKSETTTAVIVPNYTRVDVHITHKMKLPSNLKADQWWEAGLARHELEHVRVGMQPRLSLLLKHLVYKVTSLEEKVSTQADVTRDLVGKRVDMEITLRKDTVESLVRDINRKIDVDTRHGAVAMPNAENFFAGLFLKENLDEMKFPYLHEVLDLVGTRDYQQARLVIGEAASQPKASN